MRSYVLAETAALTALLDQLALLTVEDRVPIRELSQANRPAIVGIATPPDMRDEITRHLAGLGAQTAVAVRSSATTEDLPTASSPLPASKIRI